MLGRAGGADKDRRQSAGQISGRGAAIA